MAQISVDDSEFANIIICYLLRALQEKDELLFINPLFDDVLQKMYNCGLKANLLHAYMSMDGNIRVKFKMIQNTLFNETNNDCLIRVQPMEIEDEAT